ncbi:MAG: LysR substrate-binding domain-containing protein [Verrucomicrobium sp.]|nr:LysR family transcriptional regulator [Verrucomicrobium sp.]
MNVHHLELFFYVARHGGVSAAARHIPYGIQQPAISAQILQLEDNLGITLFRRRPFQLTREGQALYAFIEPFFSGLDDIARRLRGGVDNRLRIAAPEIVQREYLPHLLVRLRKSIPGFHFTLTQGRQQEIEALLHAQEIDLGLSVLTDKPGAGIQLREVATLSMVLLVSESSGIQHAQQILEQDRIDLPLITLSSFEGVTRTFQTYLRHRGVDWLPSLELGGLDLVNRYVEEGFGVGLSLQLPRMRIPTGVRQIALPGAPTVTFGALWAGKLISPAEVFVREAELLASELFAT